MKYDKQGQFCYLGGRELLKGEMEDIVEITTNNERLKIIIILGIKISSRLFLVLLIHILFQKLDQLKFQQFGLLMLSWLFILPCLWRLGACCQGKDCQLSWSKLAGKGTTYISQQSIVLAVLFGILTGLVTIFFAEPFLKLLGIEADVLKAGTLYFRIVGIPSIFMSLMFVISAILRGAGDTRSPMKVRIGLLLKKYQG